MGVGSGYSTDEYIESFIEGGLSYDDAYDLAHDYINEQGFADKPMDWAVNEDKVGFEYDDLTDEPTGVYKIGCDYRGVLVIAEHEDEKFYIPTSRHCMIKSFEKWWMLVHGEKITIPVDNISPFSASLRSMRRIMLSHVYSCQCPITHKEKCGGKACRCERVHTPECQAKIAEKWKTLPKIVNFGKYANGAARFMAMSKLGSSDPALPVIALIPFGDNSVHAIVIKPRKCSDEACVLLRGGLTTACKHMAAWKKMTREDVPIKLEKSTEIIPEFKRIQKEPIKVPVRYVYVYDIETYNELKPDGKSVRLVPYALAFTLVDLKTGTWERPTMLEQFMRTKSGEIVRKNTYIFDMMFRLIAIKAAEMGMDKVQLYAHNGSRFDNVYAKACTMVRFESEILAGRTLKSLTLAHIVPERPHATPPRPQVRVQFILKDTLPFTLASLENSCKMFRVEQQKMKFDIVGWSKERYLDDRTWVPYLDQDVVALAGLTCAIETNYQRFGLSITGYLGLPGLAWALFRKMEVASDDLHIPADPSVCEFIKAGTYGGRVLHFEKMVNEALICGDGNSLYPSAMQSSPIPPGSGWKNITDWNGFPRPIHVHYIVECEIIMPNTRKCYHPNKSDDGMLQYHSGLNRGVWNDVDLGEMIKDGGVVQRYFRGIYTVRSSRLYSNFVQKLYDERVAAGSDTAYGYVLKILLNSSYGKTLETIKSVSKFKRTRGEQIKNFTALANGQVEVRRRLTHPQVRKPIHVGMYILSYARKIMNEVIRAVGVNNIAYGDTDSVYMKIPAYERIKSMMSNGLCGFKNDYGDGRMVTFAIFLDTKRYYLEFNDGSTCCKFNGLSMKRLGAVSSHGVNLPNVRTMYEHLLKSNEPIETTVERWARDISDVTIKQAEMKFAVAPERRGGWQDGRLYNLGYDHSKPEYIRPIVNEIGQHLAKSKRGRQTLYSTPHYNPEKGWSIRSKLPISSDKADEHNQALGGKVTTNWAKIEDKYYYNCRGRYFDYNEYGMGLIEYNPAETDVINPVLFVPNGVIIPELEAKKIVKQCTTIPRSKLTRS